ncbi:MAG: hypothetical protein AAFX93_02045 [Verrucomicrobiota bacterium]
MCYLFRATVILGVGWLFGVPLASANPPPSEWQVIVPNDAGIASGSAYFPMQGAFDGSSSWDTVNSAVIGPAGAAGAPPYTERFGYIDFGPDYDEVHIMETWTRYRSFSGGSHPGYAEMWWDDDTDTTNDDGVIETRLNFNSGQGVPHLGVESWFRDKRINEVGGVRPARRYLILKSTSTYADRAQEYAIVGYLYDGLVPPEYANVPRLEIDNSTIQENSDWQQRVGTISFAGGEPGETYTLRFDPSDGDNATFRLEGMELWTTRSYDFETQSRYLLSFEIVDSEDGVTPFELEISIQDQTGAFDTNGVADAAVAAAYPEINEGDFVIWNATSTAGPSISYGAGEISIAPPNKVLIKAGIFEYISLNLSGVNGTGPTDRVPITNFLGQVYANRINLTNGSYWRLTGLYDPANGFGHVDFPGCVGPEGDVQFGFSNGRYGFWICNEWEGESNSLIYVNGTATGWEIDHVEASDGGFAGMLLKRDNNDSMDMDDVYLHHLYIHDTGSEGIYLGSTQLDPQHQFNHLLIENVLILRTGTEAIQVGQLGNNCVVRNSVFWGAMDWLSPFQRYQDNCAQIGLRQGNVIFQNNILMGAGEKFYNVSVTPKASITPNGLPFIIENNVNWGCRGIAGAYQFRNTDNTTPWIWRNNFWGGFDFHYDDVYTATWDTRNCILMASNGTTVTVTDNVHDDSRDRAIQRWASGNSTIVENGTVEKQVLEPRFINLLGDDGPIDILNWTRWTATIGEASSFPNYQTNKGEAVVYEPGQVIQHTADKRTRFYRCLQTNSNHEPPLDGDDTWELLVWTQGDKAQYCPPDDARLIEGTLYHDLGIGLVGDLTLDADADDLPDSWEKRFGLPIDSNGKQGNPDLDSRNNWEEFLAGTNPLEYDRVEELGIVILPDESRLSWVPPRGRAWKFQYSVDLINWFDLTDLQAGEGMPSETPAALSDTSRFYRTLVEKEMMMDLLP